ncbi:MAG TPA: hypothetical protein VJ484_12735 [Lysobacter sp.]|nr:hypothetical protein [Lysobacter sp.]
MLVRALIVLLLVLNAGVASWWIARDPAPPPAPAEPPPGVARLQLVGEATAQTPAAATIATATPESPPAVVATTAPGLTTAPAAQQCFSFGPFASKQAAETASAKLQPLVKKVTTREQGAIGPVRAWRVLLPPLGSLEEAHATAQRIGAAGFGDFLVVREGAEANSIALGRYRSEGGARKRMQTLAAAGFPARVEAVGATDATSTNTWLEVIADEAFDPRGAQGTIAAAQHRQLDCATLQ